MACRRQGLLLLDLAMAGGCSDAEERVTIESYDEDVSTVWESQK